MKTDLEILIEHFQIEYDHLKTSMDACITEWDFEAAEAYKGPVVYTRNKLNVLKNLQNPHFNRINQLIATIGRKELAIERTLSPETAGYEYLNEEIRKALRDARVSSCKITIEKCRKKLEELKSITPELSIDNDELLELLDRLDTDTLNKVEFEIKKDKLSLSLIVNGDEAEFRFHAINEREIGHFFHRQTNSILRKLGFDIESYSKQFKNYKTLDKQQLLEEISIISFEIFQLFGEKNEIRVTID